jgi:hypothetical protein
METSNAVKLLQNKKIAIVGGGPAALRWPGFYNVKART